ASASAEGRGPADARSQSLRRRVAAFWCTRHGRGAGDRRSQARSAALPSQCAIDRTEAGATAVLGELGRAEEVVLDVGSPRGNARVVSDRERLDPVKMTDCHLGEVGAALFEDVEYVVRVVV